MGCNSSRQEKVADPQEPLLRSKRGRRKGRVKEKNSKTESQVATTSTYIEKTNSSSSLTSAKAAEDTMSSHQDLDTEEDDDLSPGHRHVSSTIRHSTPTPRHPSSASSGYGTTSDNSLPKPRVKLPSRYLVRLSRASQDPDHNSNTKIDYPNPLPNDKENREKDLEQALKWIRQEITLMREQDKTLTSQFIGLRSRILQFRCWLEIYGSASDMSSLDGSSMSLEESRSLLSLNSSGHSGGSSLLSPDNELEFRNRTSSMRIVRRPPSICPRISEKRRSKEYA